MTDWTKLIDRLQPQPDGETATKHRTGVVDAVNLDDTIDVTLGGVTIPSVRVVAGAMPIAGAVVHLLVWRGDLIALGDICVCLSPSPASPSSPAENCIDPCDVSGLVDGQGIFYRGLTMQWENARAPEPLTDEGSPPEILFLEDDSVAMSEPFFD